MIISEHAREKMKKNRISEEDIKRCLVDGETILENVIKGGMRYLKEIDLKHRRSIVVYTIRNEEKRVITCYPKRKKRI